ncbi:MAG TPA: hypothetical protein VF139_06790 [Candidatus Polarisedimenticolaceae bacterium]
MDAELCRRLRWKGLYIDVEPDPSIPNTSDGFCWCTHSMTALGPDGEVADREGCRPGRPCFEPR